jgi:hypothetical protein
MGQKSKSLPCALLTETRPGSRMSQPVVALSECLVKFTDVRVVTIGSPKHRKHRDQHMVTSLAEMCAESCE